MRSTEARLNRLETGDAGHGCPECGYRKGDLIKLTIDTKPRAEANRFCATCRRPLCFTLDIGVASEGATWQA
ncbi:MAG: hypothetical protein WBP93_14005 [Pyrinomonadaceae bacterium]